MFIKVNDVHESVRYLAVLFRGATGKDTLVVRVAVL